MTPTIGGHWIWFCRTLCRGSPQNEQEPCGGVVAEGCWLQQVPRAGLICRLQTPRGVNPSPLPVLPRANERGFAFVLNPQSYTLHPAPYTLNPTPCTLQSDPTPYTLHPHPAPCTLHPTIYTIHPTPYKLTSPSTLHPTPYNLHPTPYTLHHTPYTLHPTPYTLHLLQASGTEPGYFIQWPYLQKSDGCPPRSKGDQEHF